MSDFPVPDPNVKILSQALDIQHDTDPAHDHGKSRRIPHLGHALLFFTIALFCIFACSAVVLIAVHAFNAASAMQHPFALVLSQLVAYVITFAISWPVFRAFWNRPFLDGIEWTWRAAGLRWKQYLVLGCALSGVAQFLDFLVKTPVTSDIAKLLQTPQAAWLTVIFGIFIAPVSEEIAFRGFLLPALATAYDWITLERTPAARNRWQQTTDHSGGALVFGTVFSSLAFAALHGSQLHWSYPTLGVLFVMSLAFSAVRIVTRSVAASTLVHIAYDALIFIEVIWATGAFRHLDKL